ncbi:GL15902 [Drosophila persimilis]|uniref:GL15902 n=1 Tax=Drosophila persimilis TaxID=7234 RepID=B4H122_DROPE|nr:GL15902 [Drosophila persimilis]
MSNAIKSPKYASTEAPDREHSRLQATTRCTTNRQTYLATHISVNDWRGPGDVNEDGGRRMEDGGWVWGPGIGMEIEGLDCKLRTGHWARLWPELKMTNDHKTREQQSESGSEDVNGQNGNNTMRVRNDSLEMANGSSVPKEEMEMERCTQIGRKYGSK